ncbi:Uncharacterised protein [Mycobacteroides abscessus subsp. bolletii]|uniref:hypothetical protein n=1 Tax=Mycobacteroides abscessus TaxID=36809 RepID=UPI0009A6313D|nr:hypothetical protein [Mycobacteroides abscessus]SKZ02915.1 Uncharacterised protein [Mycobacteroides abscessus subsp. bolletii]
MNVRTIAILGAATVTTIAAFLVVAVVLGSTTQQQRTAKTAASACSTALGVPTEPGTTVTELAGPQAAAILDPRLTGPAAATTLATLYQVANWRDVDPTALARWARQPATEPLPPGAIASTVPDSPVTQTDSYETRCNATLSQLTNRQMDNAIAEPLLTTSPTPESERAATIAESLIGQQSTGAAFIEHIASAVYPDEPIIGTPQPSALIWRGTRVAPAALARGDLIFFDYNRSGPTQVAVALNSTLVAATTGLDAPANPAGAVVTGHAPAQNVTIIRLTSTDPSTTTERPTQP